MKYAEILKKYKNQVFSTEDLAAILGSRQAIGIAQKEGLVSKIGRGFYSVDCVPGSEFLAVASKYFSNYPLCGNSALYYQNLSDFAPDYIELAAPRESSARSLENFLFRRVADSKRVGVEEKEIEGIRIKIMSPERCLFEEAARTGYSESFSKAIVKYYSLYKSSRYGKIRELGEVLPGKEMVLSALNSVRESKNIF